MLLRFLLPSIINIINDQVSIEMQTKRKKKTIRCVNSGNRNAEQEVRLQNVNSFFHFHSCRFANNCLEIRAM